MRWVSRLIAGFALHPLTASASAQPEPRDPVELQRAVATAERLGLELRTRAQWAQGYRELLDQTEFGSGVQNQWPEALAFAESVTTLVRAGAEIGLSADASEIEEGWIGARMVGIDLLRASLETPADQTELERDVAERLWVLLGRDVEYKLWDLGEIEYMRGPDSSEFGISSSFQPIGSFRYAMLALTCLAERAVVQGENEELLRSLRAIMVLEQALCVMPDKLAHLVGQQCRSAVQQLVHDLLLDPTTDQGMVGELEQLLREWPMADISPAFELERLVVRTELDAMFLWAVAKEPSQVALDAMLSTGQLKHAHQAEGIDELYRMQIDAVSMAPHDAIKANRASDEMVEAEEVMHPVRSLFYGASFHFYQGKHALSTRRAGLLTLVALRRYHAEHERWPQSLEPLTEGHIAELPIDPYSGEPLVYEVIAADSDHPAQAFRLYSAAVHGFEKPDGSGLGHYRTRALGRGQNERELTFAAPLATD